MKLINLKTSFDYFELNLYVVLIPIIFYLNFIKACRLIIYLIDLLNVS